MISYTQAQPVHHVSSHTGMDFTWLPETNHEEAVNTLTHFFIGRERKLQSACDSEVLMDGRDSLRFPAKQHLHAQCGLRSSHGTKRSCWHTHTVNTHTSHDLSVSDECHDREANSSRLKMLRRYCILTQPFTIGSVSIYDLKGTGDLKINTVSFFIF